MSQPAPVPTPLNTVQLDPVRVGQMKVWAIRDGHLALEGSLLTGIDPGEVRRMLGGKEAAETPVNTFLV